MRDWMRAGMVLGIGMVALVSGCEAERSSGSARAVVDVEMAAAETQGRATLPGFLRAFEQPRAGWSSFQVRHEYRVTETGHRDVIWLDLEGVEEDGALRCMVPEDEDERVIQFTPGEGLTIGIESVTDWLFLHQDGSFVGGYTLRVAMDRQFGRDGSDEKIHGGTRFLDLDDLTDE